MKIKTQFNYEPSKGDKMLEGDIKTVPGQSFEMREIVSTFIRTGRVLGASMVCQYDEDTALDEEAPCDVFDGPDVDLTDIAEAATELTNVRTQREAINKYAVMYAQGNITYDEFVDMANRQNKEIAAPFIKQFGEKLKKKDKDNPPPAE